MKGRDGLHGWHQCPSYCNPPLFLLLLLLCDDDDDDGDITTPTILPMHFQINERHRGGEKEEEREGGLCIFSHMLTAVQLPHVACTCSHPERQRQTDVPLLASGFPFNFFIFPLRFLYSFHCRIPPSFECLEWTVFLPALFPCQHGNCRVQKEEFKKRCDIFCGSKS